MSENKYKIINYLLPLIIIILIILVLLSNKTMAYQYNQLETNLFYTENKEELEVNIKNYLEDIDDIIIPNTIYNLSDVLNENYDFLAYFAIDYVLSNYEYYEEEIIVKEEYKYLTKEMQEKTTDKYISKDIIDDIVNKYFGVNVFVIINNDINVIDNYVSLTDYTSERFTDNIKKVSIIDSNEDTKIIKVLAEYDNNSYVYTFNNDNNILKIKNVEV